MSNFGFISPLLAPKPHPAWKRLTALFPGLIHFLPTHPKAVGPITGSIFDKPIQGYSFSTPGLPTPAWSESRIALFWDRFCKELHQRDVTVVGLDPGTPQPPPQLLEVPDFPGIGDGKALELLLFNLNFCRILDYYEIIPPKATATVIWEEGNLGLTCARLIGQELRFLTLIHPNLKNLEQAAAVISAETGLAPRIFTEVPKDYHEWGIIIQCGRLIKRYEPEGLARNPHYHLFGGTTALRGENLGLVISLGNLPGDGPLIPALGEAVVRAGFELEKGVWCGPQLPLERVMELERVYKELNR